MTHKKNKINELALVDPSTKIDYLYDVWGNDPNISHNDDTGEYESDEDTYIFWRDYASAMQRQLNRKEELLRELDGTAYDALIEDLEANMVCDIEDEPRFLEQILDRHTAD